MDNTVERIIRGMRLEPETGCWVWKNNKDRDSYGRVRIGGRKTTGAHRLSYITFVGQIPNGMRVLHKCDNPSCVNPEHLFLGTHSDNMRDMYNKRRHPRARNHNIK